ncbi:MAG TPA: hypothetical protein VL328_14725 [Gemmatimonadaceae bacterium]|jgi:hypothetical protein|nr:hypothetical protein [Gemmatimonadaceae bacterium]
MTKQIVGRTSLLLASLALGAACAGGSGGDAVSRLVPTAPSRVITAATAAGQAGNGAANQGEVEVCKYGAAGVFIVTTSANPTAVEYPLDAGQCVVVAVDVTSSPSFTTVNVTEKTIATSTFQSVQETLIQNIVNTNTDATPTVTSYTDSPARSERINQYHGALLEYHNLPVTPPPTGHCSYTQGWYKNHTSSWPQGALTPTTVWDGGATIITLFNTPPRGSQYIILAHQYITALLNIQGGSNVPPAVQDALDKAEQYFSGGGDGKGDSSVDITGVSTVLDNYNNGLTAGGPAHCG